MYPSSRLLFLFPVGFVLLWMYHSYSQQQQPEDVPRSTCDQSLSDSDGFICELDASWSERKLIYHDQDKKNMIKRPDTYYFLPNWEPNFHCSHARRIGAMGDGGKWVCDPYRLKSRADCLIYSVGSAGDFSFEIEMKQVLSNCEIHTFDKGRYPCPVNVCEFHQVMFGDQTDRVNTSKSWTTIINELNHTHRSIDILKIDIDGGEFRFFPQLLSSAKQFHPRQILLEVHPANVTLIHELFDLIRSYDYTIYSKENNVLAGPYFFEFSFLRLNRRFFNNPPPA